MSTTPSERHQLNYYQAPCRPVMMLSRLAFSKALPALAKRVPKSPLQNALRANNINLGGIPAMTMSHLAFSRALPTIAKRAPITLFQDALNANNTKSGGAPVMNLSVLARHIAVSVLAKRAPTSSIGATSCLRRSILNAPKSLSKRHAGTEATPADRKNTEFEISRRFLPTDASNAALRANSGTPRLDGLEYIGSQVLAMEGVEESEWDDEEEFDLDCYNKGRPRIRLHIVFDMSALPAKMQIYRSRINPGFDEIRDKLKVLRYLSDNGDPHTEYHICWHHSMRVLDMHIRREEWRVGNYVIKVNKHEVTWADLPVIAGGKVCGSECLLTTGSLSLCKIIEERTHSNEIMEKEGVIMKRFMEEHRWAFGMILEQSTMENYYL
jgi:hypothetical protein